MGSTVMYINPKFPQISIIAQDKAKFSLTFTMR